MNPDTQKANEALLKFVYDPKTKKDQQLTLGRKDYPNANFESIWGHNYGREDCSMHLTGDSLKITKL